MCLVSFDSFVRRSRSLIEPVDHIWKFDLEEYEILSFGMSLVFQKFELSLSCSVFSRQLKLSEIKGERPNRNCKKVTEKQQREIAIRNFRDYIKNTRVELSYLDIRDREITKEDQLNQSEPSVER